MILDPGACERGAVSGSGRSHFDAAIAKGEQERNPKMMILSSDAEQTPVQGVILLAALAGRVPVGGM
jgi:hypothetical protein